MYHELSKREKKLARELIDKGVKTEFKIALEQAASILSEWKEGDLDNRAAYQKLFSHIWQHDKFISRRYDSLSGSRYLITVAQIYLDGQITEEDIKDFSEQTKAVLNNFVRLHRETENNLPDS